jgi:hypothetical protein
VPTVWSVSVTCRGGGERERERGGSQLCYAPSTSSSFLKRERHRTLPDSPTIERTQPAKQSPRCYSSGLVVLHDMTSAERYAGEQNVMAHVLRATATPPMDALPIDESKLREGVSDVGTALSRLISIARLAVLPPMSSKECT